MNRPSAFGRVSQLLVVSATAALVSVASAANDVVVSLTTKTFDDVVAKEPLVLVKFTAPWCGHCQALTEPFAAAASDLKDTAVLADVDATAEEKLAEKYEIQGFPTIKMFVNGSFLTDYKGDRSTAAIVSFVKRATLPPFEELADAAAVKTFAEVAAAADETTAVYAVAPTEEITTAFRAAVFALRDAFPDTMKFASVFSAAAAAQLAGASGKTIKDGDVVVVSADKSVEIKPAGDEGIDAWVKALAVPVFGEFSQANSELYTEGEKAVAVIFTESNKKAGTGVAEMEKVANAYKGNTMLNFAYVDNSELSQFSDYLGLKQVVPPIAIYSFASDVKFLMPEETRGDKFTDAALSAWIKDYLDGKLVPLIKSQPIPESNDGPIKEVVGDTWKSVVEDTEKDVLVMTHAEWCGHCKAAMPKLEAAAKALSDVTTVTIARMDGTENDAPDEYKAKGFPTIHFFPAGKEQMGVEYDGGRTAREFVAYLKENATHKFAFDFDRVPEEEGPEEEEPEELEGEEDDLEAEDLQLDMRGPAPAPSADAGAAQDDKSEL